MNGVFRIVERLLEVAFERIILFRAAGGFKDFPRDIFERADTGGIKSRMRQSFAVRFAARDAKSGISPEFAFVGKAMRRLNVSDKPTGGDLADTGGGLQQTHFRELTGGGEHRAFGGGE